MSQSEYPIRPQKLVVATAASITATTAATPTTIGVVTAPTRFVYFTSTSNQAVALTIRYPGEAPQDWIDIPATTTSIQQTLDLGASNIRLGGVLLTLATVGSVTIGGYNLGVAPTAGRITLSFS